MTFSFRDRPSNRPSAGRPARISRPDRWPRDLLGFGRRDRLRFGTLVASGEMCRSLAVFIAVGRLLVGAGIDCRPRCECANRQCARNGRQYNRPAAAKIALRIEYIGNSTISEICRLSPIRENHRLRFSSVPQEHSDLQRRGNATVKKAILFLLYPSPFRHPSPSPFRLHRRAK